MTVLMLGTLVACGASTSARSTRDATQVRVIPPGEPEPSLAEELSFPTAPPPASSVRATAQNARKPLHPMAISHRVQLGAVTEWRSRYPFAAEELGTWVRQHPDAAADLFLWDHQNPDRVEVLTEWAITNPEAPLASFFLTRPGWDTLRQLTVRHPDGMQAYLQWCRKSPTAATELARHSQGLAWAGENLYSGELGTRSARLHLEEGPQR